jgi:hypothetical protein
MTTGNVEITILDNTGGQVVVPANEVQVVIGCSSGGTSNQIVGTRLLPTLTSSFLYGPLCEAAGATINAGGTVLAIKVPSNTTGTAGTVVHTGTGTAVMSLTSTNADGYYDDYCIKVKATKAGTIGTTGAMIAVSLDAGRSFGPNIALLTASTVAIPQTGVTLNFSAAGTLVLNDVYCTHVTGPRWNLAGVQAALTALSVSAYADAGFGSLHVVGPCSGTDAAAIQTTLDAMSVSYLYTRCMVDDRDGYVPTAFGGAGETEATWMNSVMLEFSANATKRVLVNAGHYNMPMVFANPIAGTPLARRSLGNAQAARQVQIPPQRHSGRCRDGSLNLIVINPVTDPNDGFIYHDEQATPGFDGARFCSARLRRKLQGFFIANPNLMASTGSDFYILPVGNVMDIACGIVHQVGQLQINDDLRLNANGTLYKNDAQTLESEIRNALNTQMVSTGYLSGLTVAVDLTTNVKTTKTVVITVALVGKGYVLQENVTIGFLSA